MLLFGTSVHSLSPLWLINPSDIAPQTGPQLQ